MKTSFLKASGLLFAFVTIAAAQTTLPTVAIEPNPWRLDIGLNYVTGDYGLSQSTDVWLQTNTISHEQDAWRFDLMVPFISVTGPASVIGSVSRGSTATERGLGDMTVAATYKFFNPGTEVSDFDLTVRFKLPTADDSKGLGTGRTDTNFEVNYHHSLGTVTPFATAGYRFLGRSTAYPLQDGFYTTLGLAAPIADGSTTSGLALTWRQRIVAGADDATEVMAFVAHQIDPRWKAQGFALTGFNDASPRLGLGALVGFKF